MNELVVTIKGDGWFYYPTTANNAATAYLNFKNAMTFLNINDDNIGYKKAFLRDANGEEIDEIKINE